MAGFNGSLLVGTNNVSGPGSYLLYVLVDFLGVDVPGDAMSQGCEVWRYASGAARDRVATAGFDGDRNNFGARAMSVFDGALYAGTINVISGIKI
jgi:hypothetical protein